MTTPLDDYAKKLLADITAQPLPLAFVKHLTPEARAAFHALFTSGQIAQLSSVDNCYHAATSAAPTAPAQPSESAAQDERTLEQRLTSGKAEDRAIGRDELQDAVALIASGKVQPIEGHDFVRMPAPSAPRTKLSKLTARNSKACDTVKARYNAKIYRLFLRKANTEGLYSAVRWLVQGYVHYSKQAEVSDELLRLG